MHMTVTGTDASVEGPQTSHQGKQHLCPCQTQLFPTVSAAGTVI